MSQEILSKSLLEAIFKGKIITTKSGNSGEVYIVEFPKDTHPRRVAFKTFKLKEKLTDEQIGYFLEECELWFTIKNPYIIVPFYAEVVASRPFLCMPYCQSDLKTLMLENQLDEVSALVLSCRLIKAVIEMRNAGIRQHQDLNPPNVLVQDLAVNFPDHTRDHLLNCDLKISDFGIANLRQKVGPTIGGGGGKFPFKAPEQYDTHKYRAYDPDMFALGVMLYMLLTGQHPNGLVNAKALNRNTSKSFFQNWMAIDKGITYHNQAIETILNQALQRDPADRPQPTLLLTAFMEALRTANFGAHQYLHFRFDYQDKYHAFTYPISRLENLVSISALPGKRTQILSRLLAMLDDQREKVNDAAGLIYYGQILEYTNRTTRKKDSEVKQILPHALFLLKQISKYRQTLTVDLQYPKFDLPGFQNWQPHAIRDYEIAGIHASVAIGLIQAINGKEQIEQVLREETDDFLWSLYYYHQASKARITDMEKAGEYLNKAKEHWPDESIFDYMRNLWKSML